MKPTHIIILFLIGILLLFFTVAFLLYDEANAQQDTPDKLIANRNAKIETLHLSMEAFNNCEEWRIRECALVVYISARDVLEAVEMIELYEKGI